MDVIREHDHPKPQGRHTVIGKDVYCIRLTLALDAHAGPSCNRQLSVCGATNCSYIVQACAAQEGSGSSLLLCA